MDTNILQNNRARLTALTPADIPTVTDWYQDTGFSRMLDACPARPKTEVALKQWQEKGQNAHDFFLFAVRPPAADTMLGFVELDGVLWAHRVCGLGLAIGPKHQRKGYGRAAMELALMFAFDELNLHRVQLTVFGYNARAIALYESLGFTREGTFREFMQRDGQRYDMYLYGLLHHEWGATRAA